MGRNVILAPIEVQQAFQFAFEEIFEPLRIQVRWLNYTIHPEFDKSGAAFAALMTSHCRLDAHACTETGLD